MVAFRKALLFGCLIWVFAFAVAFALFPIRTSARPVFESIMPVALAAATVFFAHRYFTRVRARFAREGLLLGIVWMAVNLLIDLPLMLSPRAGRVLRRHRSDIPPDSRSHDGNGAGAVSGE